MFYSNCNCVLLRRAVGIDVFVRAEDMYITQWKASPGKELSQFIHPIQRFKSSDWLKEGYMAWIIFDNVHVWKLIHVC